MGGKGGVWWWRRWRGADGWMDGMDGWGMAEYGGGEGEKHWCWVFGYFGIWGCGCDDRLSTTPMVGLVTNVPQ